MSPALRGHLAMLLFSALVAGSFALGALMANLISPVAFTAVRFLVAGAIIGVAAVATTGVTRDAWVAPWRYLVLGTIFAGYFILMFEGLKTAPPVSAAAVFTLTPILSAAFGWLLLRQVTTPRISAALAIGAAGALWVIFRADPAALFRFEVGRGEAIYFIGCVAHAVYTPLVRRLNRGEHPVVFTFGMLIAGSAVTTAYGWGAIRATDWAALPGIVWITLAYYGGLRQRGDLRASAIRHAAPALGQGHGLYLSHAVLGNPLAGGARPTRAGVPGRGRRGPDGGGIAHAPQGGGAARGGFGAIRLSAPARARLLALRAGFALRAGVFGNR